MATTIRLSRHGGKKSPFYRIVVADTRAPRDGRNIEQVGIYDPKQNPARIEFREEKLAEWMRMGARPSATVAQLMKKSGLTRAGEVKTGETS